MTKKICATILALTMACTAGVTSFAEAAVTESTAVETATTDTESIDESAEAGSESVAETAETDATTSAAESTAETETEDSSADSTAENTETDNTSTEEETTTATDEGSSSSSVTRYEGGYVLQSGDWYYVDYGLNEAMIVGYSGDSENITIPSTIDKYTVTALDGYEGFGDVKVKSVTIPDTVEKIGIECFKDCTSLKSVNIPDSVTYIGYDAFENTPLINNQTSTVKYVGKWAVDCDGSAKSAKVKSGTVGVTGFKDCTKLKSVKLPSSLKYINSEAFRQCTNLKSVTLSNSLKTIGDYAFENCTSLKSLTLPDSLKIIGGSAFKGCTNLASVNIPNSVTEIGSYAFYDTAIINNQKTTVKYIGKWAIDGDDSAKSVKIKSGTVGIANGAFDGAYDSKLKSVTLPNTLKYIGGDAFQSEKLKSVKIPKSVKSIGECAFLYTTIKCYSGSAAAKCAKKYKIDYLIIDKKPSTPTIKKAGTSTTAVRLYFTKVSGISGYKVQQYNTKTKKWVTVGKSKVDFSEGTGYNYKITGLKSGTKYKYRVQAYTALSSKTLKSGWSKTFTVTTK